MVSSVTTGRGATTGCSTRRNVTSTGRLTIARVASSPAPVRVHPDDILRAHSMPRSVTTGIPEGNWEGLTTGPGETTLLVRMPEEGPRARLLHVAIWLATLFFAVMLFVPLIREALRRAAQPLPGGHF